LVGYICLRLVIVDLIWLRLLLRYRLRVYDVGCTVCCVHTRLRFVAFPLRLLRLFDLVGCVVLRTLLLPGCRCCYVWLRCCPGWLLLCLLRSTDWLLRLVAVLPRLPTFVTLHVAVVVVTVVRFTTFTRWLPFPVTVVTLLLVAVGYVAFGWLRLVAFTVTFTFYTVTFWLLVGYPAVTLLVVTFTFTVDLRYRLRWLFCYVVGCLPLFVVALLRARLPVVGYRFTVTRLVPRLRCCALCPVCTLDLPRLRCTRSLFPVVVCWLVVVAVTFALALVVVPVCYVDLRCWLVTRLRCGLRCGTLPDFAFDCVGSRCYYAFTLLR